MALTDLSFPLTGKKIGPGATTLSRAKVFYVSSKDLISMEARISAGDTILKVRGPRRKVEVYETPDQVLAMQALSQGATASQVFTKAYGALLPTSSATYADGTVPTKYYNEVVTTATVNTVRVPDPFTLRLFVVQNLTGTAINVYPRGTTQTINGATGAYSIGAYERIHFVAPTAATAGTTAPWQTARDVGS